MKQWAYQVEQLQIHCAVCQRIAQRVLRGNPLLYGEKVHLEQDVSAARSAYRGGSGMVSRRALRGTCPGARERQPSRTMDTEDDHARRVNTYIRLSLPNAPGTLSTVAAAVSVRGGLVRAVQSLHEDPWRRVVEIDLVAAGREQCGAIIAAITYLSGVLLEGETDPAPGDHYGGTIAVQARVPFGNEQDFSAVYTPGMCGQVQTYMGLPPRDRKN